MAGSRLESQSGWSTFEKSKLWVFDIKTHFSFQKSVGVVSKASRAQKLCFHYKGIYVRTEKSLRAARVNFACSRFYAVESSSDTQTKSWEVILATGDD